MSALLQATARRLCKLDADSFGVTLEDLWAERGESYLIDAQEVVEATGAGELLAALLGLLDRHNDGSDEGPWAEWDAASEAIATATGERQ